MFFYTMSDFNVPGSRPKKARLNFGNRPYRRVWADLDVRSFGPQYTIGRAAHAAFPVVLQLHLVAPDEIIMMSKLNPCLRREHRGDWAGAHRPVEDRHLVEVEGRQVPGLLAVEVSNFEDLPQG